MPRYDHGKHAFDKAVRTKYQSDFEENCLDNDDSEEYENYNSRPRYQEQQYYNKNCKLPPQLKTISTFHSLLFSSFILSSHAKMPSLI